jgi:hypothetical protein
MDEEVLVSYAHAVETNSCSSLIIFFTVKVVSHPRIPGVHSTDTDDDMSSLT